VARKKEAHHGGAWKVAFADFMTAMMALFLVLWISAQEKKILIATARYFQNPFKAALTNNAGVMPFDSNKVSKDAGQDEGSGKQTNSVRQVELAFLNSLARDFYRLLHLDESFEDKPIEFQVTSDGLHVTLFDRPNKALFKENTAEFTEWGQFVMQNLAWMIERHKFRVVIEGHTRGGISFPRPDYTAWELSADRANAARRLLTYYAVGADQIERVSGFANTRPISGLAPEAESNQRVTLSLSVHHPPPPPAPPALAATAGKPPAGAPAKPATSSRPRLQLFPSPEPTAAAPSTSPNP
jgi:chemotaxis protein MotB